MTGAERTDLRRRLWDGSVAAALDNAERDAERRATRRLWDDLARPSTDR